MILSNPIQPLSSLFVIICSQLPAFAPLMTLLRFIIGCIFLFLGIDSRAMLIWPSTDSMWNMRSTMDRVSLCKFWTRLHRIFPNIGREWDRISRYRLTISWTAISIPLFNISIRIITVCSIIWTKNWMSFISRTPAKIIYRSNLIWLITILSFYGIKHILLRNIQLQQQMESIRLELKLMLQCSVVLKIWGHNWVKMGWVNKILRNYWIRVLLFKI